MKIRLFHVFTSSWPRPPAGLIWLLLAGIGAAHLVFSLVIFAGLRQQPGPPLPAGGGISRTTLNLMFYPVLQGDARRYVQDRDKYREIALTMNREGGFALSPDSHETLRRMPAYPVFLSLIHGLGGTGPWVVALAQLLLVLVACYWCYRLAGGSAGYDGLAAAAILGGYPLVLVYVPRYYSEILTLFLVTGALFCLQGFLQTGRAVRLWLFFLFIALAWLSRASVAIWLVPLLVMLGWEARRRRRLVAFGIGLLLLAACISPWLVRNAVLTGQIVAGSTWNSRSAVHGLYTVTHPWAEQAHSELDQLYQHEMGRRITERIGPVDSPRQEARENREALRLYLETLRQRPGSVLLNGFRGFFRMYFYTSSALMRHVLAGTNLLLVVFLYLGIGRLSAGENVPFRRACWLLLGTFYLFHSLVYPAVRYLLPALPALALLAAPGVTTLLERLRQMIHARA